MVLSTARGVRVPRLPIHRWRVGSPDTSGSELLLRSSPRPSANPWAQAYKKTIDCVSVLLGTLHQRTLNKLSNTLGYSLAAV